MGYVQTLAVTLTRRAAQALVKAVDETLDDRLFWQPLDQGRSILQQVIDCALANLKWAQILEHRAYGRLPRAYKEVAEIALTTREDALARLAETTEQLVEAISGVADSEVARMLAIPGEDGVDLTVAEACLHSYWNMVYHEGQIRYIQSLYTDMDADAAPQSPLLALAVPS